MRSPELVEGFDFGRHFLLVLFFLLLKRKVHSRRAGYIYTQKTSNTKQTLAHSANYFPSWYSFCTTTFFLFCHHHHNSELYFIPRKIPGKFFDLLLCACPAVAGNFVACPLGGGIYPRLFLGNIVVLFLLPDLRLTTHDLRLNKCADSAQKIFCY